MKIIGIDKKKCIVCIECVKDCPPRLFSENRDNADMEVIFSDPYNRCIQCGHCISVCPHDAILFESGEKSLLLHNVPGAISYDDMLFFLCGKRSVRQYINKSLSRKEIDAVLAAMQYAPSASNARCWQYIVITNREIRDNLAKEVTGIMEKFRLLFHLKWLLYPFLPEDVQRLVKNPATVLYLQKFLSDCEKGIDRLFFHAPCLIILHSPKYAHMAGNDAGIAFTYGMLAAESLGLGTCWIGFAQEAFFLKKALKKRLGIPKKHNVNGVMVMGYPDVMYHRLPVREPLEVRYFE